MTALGSVFDIASFDYAEDINRLVSTEQIGTICIVNDIYCRFISNILNNKIEYPTKADETLKSIYESQQELIEAPGDFVSKAKWLARENIHRQGLELLKVAFIGNKIRDGRIKVFGSIYNRLTGEFEEFMMEDLMNN